MFGMGDNTDNQLGISQRGKSEDPVLQLNAPARIHLSAHSRAAKPVQVSCGASHTAAVTGQSNAVFPAPPHWKYAPPQLTPRPQNIVFSLKTHQMLSVHIPPEKFGNSTNPRQQKSLSALLMVRTNHVILLRKDPFPICFPFTLKQKAGVFKLLRF